MSNDLSRRKFIKTLMAGVAMGPVVLNYQRNNTGGIPTRPLGNTGEHVSILGYGGWDTAVPEVSESIKMINDVDGVQSEHLLQISESVKESLATLKREVPKNDKSK